MQQNNSDQSISEKSLQIKEAQLHPYPKGWYVVADSKDVLPGKIVSKKIFGQEIIIFRTQKGKICVAGAFCPHLGAHIGKGGAVENETVRCPFHDFCFDTDGNCVKTGYEKTPPKNAKLSVWNYQELNGFILVWFHKDGTGPEWKIPAIDFTGWSQVKTIEWKLKSHPQETAENSVDLGHLSIVHKYKGVEMINPVKTTGPYLNAKYAMHRNAGFIGKPKKYFRSEFEVHVHGLGYSFVEVDVPEFGIRTRHFVFPTPLDGEHINLKVGISLMKIEKKSKVHPLLSVFPDALANKLVLNGAFKGYAHDVSQDFFVWENKKYVQTPVLAEGDGPIMLYRKWCEQFY
ncbi:MAG: Rieske (2Fe-2S) protein [Bacteroidia bacterium]|nr:Rieske (2Fe-2S) protein [Bacteroidia bacterium]